MREGYGGKFKGYLDQLRKNDPNLTGLDLGDNGEYVGKDGEDARVRAGANM